MKEGILFFAGFLVFVCGMLFTATYEATLRQECRGIAIEKGYTAVEVQAVCKL
jgi:hypothetical protein